MGLRFSFLLRYAFAVFKSDSFFRIRKIKYEDPQTRVESRTGEKSLVWLFGLPMMEQRNPTFFAWLWINFSGWTKFYGLNKYTNKESLNRNQKYKKFNLSLSKD